MKVELPPDAVAPRHDEAPTAAPGDRMALDFQALFEATPGVTLVLAPDAPRFTMLACSDERLAVTLTTREATIGRPLFDVFADANPENPEPNGVANLRASLETVLRTRAPHRMAVQRYDLRRPDGTWEVRYWAPRNVPVLGPDGEVRYIVHAVQDVTDLVLEREATAAAERRAAELRAVLESMPDGVYLSSADGITLANQAALEQFGYARREELPRSANALSEALHMRDAATGEPLPAERHAFVRALDGERVAQDVVVRHRTTGEDRVLRCVATPVVVAGAVVAAVVVHTDVTEQDRARREIKALLAESERARGETEAARARSDAVLASIADAFYLLDHDWRFLYVNDAAEPLLQTTRAALLGRTLWEAFPDVIGSPFEGPYREAMATGRVTAVEAYFAPLGTWFDVHTYPWAGGLMVHFRDVGARKAAEAERERLLHALEIERARLEQVFDRSPSFIVAFTGPDLVYRFVNEAYYQLVGHRDIVGKPLLEAIPEIRGQGFDDLLDRVRQTGESWVGHETPVQLQRTPGAPLETRYLDMVFQPLVEAEGTPAGVVVHGSDVTTHVLARREVERLLGESERARSDAEAARRDADRARAEAEAANRGKSEFLAVMSHELRTPLNAIGGYAELIEMGIRGPITLQQRDDLRRLQASQRHLLGLITEVLNYARLETGTVQFDLAPVRVRDALAGAEGLVSPQAHASGLTLTTTDCTPELAVRADPEKLRQILVNLLSNAVKFTDRGGHVELACEAAGAQVRITVRDTGIGIAADQLERIFDPFVQVRSGLTRPHDGAGLGLAISRDLARKMGGELTVESTSGVGSVFTLTLPRA